jgi:hypothetical protein
MLRLCRESVLPLSTSYISNARPSGTLFGTHHCSGICGRNNLPWKEYVIHRIGSDIAGDDSRYSRVNRQRELLLGIPQLSSDVICLLIQVLAKAKRNRARETYFVPPRVRPKRPVQRRTIETQTLPNAYPPPIKQAPIWQYCIPWFKPALLMPVTASKISTPSHKDKHNRQPRNNEQEDSQKFDGNEEAAESRTCLRTNRIRGTHYHQKEQ